jgi:hypothetical protein
MRPRFQRGETVHQTMPDTPAPCHPRKPRGECFGCARYNAKPAATEPAPGEDKWTPVLDVAAITRPGDPCPMALPLLVERVGAEWFSVIQPVAA